MSDPSSPRHIPVGKLESVTVGKPRRTATDKALEAALPPKDREFPWLIAGVLAGAGAWLVAVVGVALSGLGAAPPPRPEDLLAAAGPPAVKLEAVAVAPVKVAPAAKPPLAPEPEPVPAPAADLAAELVPPPDAPPVLERRRVRPAEAPPTVVAPAPAPEPEPVPEVPMKAAPPMLPGLPVVMLPADKDRACAIVHEDLGTNVVFVKDPPAAFQQAKKEDKMVFMIHLSGNFEDRGFT